MNDKYWEEEIETMPREELHKLQLRLALGRQSALQQIPPITNKFFKSTALRQTASGR